MNREHRLKLTYPVCGCKYTETVLSHKPVFYSALSGIRPGSGPPMLVENLTQDQFLATPVLKLGPQILTIKDLISISANTLGGIHRDVAKQGKEKALEEFDKNFLVVPGVAIGAGQLRSVILVVLDALRPLREVVKENAPPRRI